MLPLLLPPQMYTAWDKVKDTSLLLKAIATILSAAEKSYDGEAGSFPISSIQVRVAVASCGY